MIENWKTVHRLKLLLRFRTRIVEVCRKVLDKTTEESSRRLMESLDLDHECYIAELRMVTAISGQDVLLVNPSPPKVLSDALAAMEMHISEETRIRICLQWEEHGIEAYDEALAEQHPPDVQALLQRHRIVEARHVAILRSAVNSMVNSMVKKT